MIPNGNNILRQFSRCPLCNTEYGDARISVVEQRENRTVFHITCPSCGVSMMLTIAQEQMGLLCVGTVTDITTQELWRLAEPRIQPNNVLDVYADMRAYTGSLLSAIGAHTRKKENVTHEDINK